MDTIFIEQYNYSFTAADVLEKLGMPRDHTFGETMATLLKEAEALARPQAFFMEVNIEERTENTVTIAGQVLRSAALAKSLAKVHKVYPFLCTCGKELADYAETLEHLMDQYAFDAFMDFYLRKAYLALTATLANHLPENAFTTSVNPGSLLDWPLEEQKSLFTIFGGNAAKIGVELTATSLMKPVKSISGILYQNEEEKKNCTLCQRTECPNRETAFDQGLFIKTFTS